jgi:NADH-quinone oxidoreductase subunit J
MTLSFALISIVTIAAATAAMSLRNLVHCALALTATFAGLAATYLQLDAQFVGLIQVLVYIGGVAILVVVAILLTRGGEAAQGSVFSASGIVGAGVTAAVLGVLVWAINHSAVMQPDMPPEPHVTVKQIGETLMNQFVLPLEVTGLLLTAALIGAVLIAMREPAGKIADRQSPIANPESQISNLKSQIPGPP